MNNRPLNSAQLLVFVDGAIRGLGESKAVEAYCLDIIEPFDYLNHFLQEHELPALGTTESARP